MRNNQLTFTQKFVCNSYTFAQQTTGILTEVENQSFQVAHLFERLCYLVLGSLLETRDVHVANTGTNQEVQIHAVTWNLIANNIEVERLVGAFTQNRDSNRGA